MGGSIILLLFNQAISGSPSPSPSPSPTPIPTAINSYTNAYPIITFKVNFINLQKIFSYEQLDTLDNTLNTLKATTMSIPGVPGDVHGLLHHGDTFTLCGPQALYIKNVYTTGDDPKIQIVSQS